VKAERLVMGLDVGSARTTAVIAEAVGGAPRRPGVRVLGVAQARTTGLRRGAVADIEEAARAVRGAVAEAERMAGARAEAVFAGIAGEHVRALTSQGIVAVAGEEITRADVDRVNAVARALAIPPDRELLHAIPQEYTVDRTTGIQDPIGMGGMRLETDMYLVTIGSQPAANLRKCIERAGHHVRELVLEPLASALAVLTEDEKELGVTLVELGASSTDVAVFHENKIRHLANVPYGGAHVTNDLVHGVNLSQADADHLKESYGVALERMVDPDEVIELPHSPTHGERHVPRELLAHIIHQRFDEIFDLVVRGVRGAGLGSPLAGGVVLTGGGAELPGVAELARDVFGTPVRVGRPQAAISGLREALDTPREATVAGLVLYGASRLALGGAAAAGPRRVPLAAPGVDRWANRLKLWLQDFF
jgi:cell division protein FtsA